MTTGTKSDDSRTSAPTYDIGNGIYYPRGNALVGMKYYKTWGGGDYPATLPTSIFQRYFDRIPFDGNKALPDHPKSSYREVWAQRRLPRRQTVADHSYTMSLEMYSNSTFVYQQLNLSYFGDNWYSVRGFRENFGDGYDIDASSRWTANDTIALAGKLRDKIAGSDFNMGVALGEGRESLRLISNTAIRLAKALSALKRGDIATVASVLGVKPPKGSKSSPKRTPTALSEIWLELQYGWLPLLKDVRGAAEALAHQLNVPIQQVYRIRSSKPLVANPYAWVAAGGGWRFVGMTRGQLIARVTEVDVPALYGLKDPASILWELTPYSFVADWFIPIGNYLAARGLDSALTAIYVTTITTDERFSCGALKLSLPKAEMLVQPNVRVSRITVNRTVGASLGTPRPNFKPLSKVASWQHCTNAVALLVGRFGSH